MVGGRKNSKADDEYLINWFVPITPFLVSVGSELLYPAVDGIPLVLSSSSFISSNDSERN